MHKVASLVRPPFWRGTPMSTIKRIARFAAAAIIATGIAAGAAAPSDAASVHPHHQPGHVAVHMLDTGWGL
jgi:hypothetical protein